MIESDVNIRLFAEPDQDAVRQLIVNGLGEHFSIIDNSLNSDLENITATYLNRGDLFFIAEVDKRIIAAGALVRETPTIGRIVRVSVTPEFRRIGIGQKIVGQLVEMARRLHFRQVIVETNLDWHQAIALYQKLGFAEYARDSECIHFWLEI